MAVQKPTLQTLTPNQKELIRQSLILMADQNEFRADTIIADQEIPWKIGTAREARTLARVFEPR